VVLNFSNPGDSFHKNIGLGTNALDNCDMGVKRKAFDTFYGKPQIFTGNPVNSHCFLDIHNWTMGFECEEIEILIVFILFHLNSVSFLLKDCHRKKPKS